MTKESYYFHTVLEDFKEIIKNPDIFLNVDNLLSNKIKGKLKETYDFCKLEDRKVFKSDEALPELIIKNFDLEQIWQQLELQNDGILTGSIERVSKLIVNKDQLLFSNLENHMQNIENEESDELNITDIADGRDTMEDTSSSESEILDLNDQEDSDQDNSDNGLKSKTYMKKSVLDDEFFKLDEMENFLNVEEKKLQHVGADNDEGESESEAEGSIDLFKEDLEDVEDKTKTAKFRDFFVAKEDNKKIKRNKFLEDMSDGDEEDLSSDQIGKSSLELRQERLRKKIEEIEENAVSEKPWQLKGEIRAQDRPQNSLLQEIVEFDLTSKPAPIITEQTTLQLEDIIMQRIKDHVFDSVVRKVKPVETPLEFKKKIVLDQEKSKQSLAQIYEKEFLEQKAALDPENTDKEEVEPQLHKEINTLMRNLFNKLDALSNFHFTPKPAISELKIVNNLPAISMEEVAPVAASDAALLAPEEVRNKVKGDILGKSERTTTDKNRERRNKKLKQRAHLKEKQKRENVISKLNPGLGNKYSKEKTKKLLQQVTKDKNIEKMDETGGSKNLKSSKAFFTKLQEEVQTHINNKVQRKKPKNHNQLLAKQIKL